MSDVNKIVLAYSGGLDTSVILRWLQETYQCEVVAFSADLGYESVERARTKAEQMGVRDIRIEDLRETFVRDYVFPMFRANALYEGTYLLGTSIARPLIARRQVEIAREAGADAVAHGATGKGNDQVSVRAQLLRAQSGHPRHRSLADLGLTVPNRPAHVRGGAPDPDRQRERRRAPLFHRFEPAAHLLRGQGARGPVART